MLHICIYIYIGFFLFQRAKVLNRAHNAGELAALLITEVSEK